jgi:hypothetical protein
MNKESRFILANRVIAELMGAPDPVALRHDFYSKEVTDALLADEPIVMIVSLRE